MVELIEQSLKFEFADTWQVLKLDEHPSYTNWIEKLDGTKSLDFLGLHNNILYLIEIKDFRGYRIQNQPRLTDGELAVEFGQKVKDSIACIVGSFRNPAFTDLYREYFRKLENEQAIRLVLWLEYHLPNNNRQRAKVKSSVESNIYKKKVRWLGSHYRVFVSNMNDNQLPETIVTNISHTP